MGQARVRTTLGTSFRDAAAIGVKGVLFLLEGSLEGGQGLEQLGLRAWEFVFGDEPKCRCRYMFYRFYRRVCVRV